MRGLTNALAVLAVAPRGAMMNPGPAFYMEKFVASAAGTRQDRSALAAGEEARDPRRGARQGHLRTHRVRAGEAAPPRTRERDHRAPARASRSIPAGDVAGALMAAIPGSGIDALMGTGGTPEGVMSACAIRAIGGEFLGRLDPQLHTEARAVKEAGIDTVEMVRPRRDHRLGQRVFLRHRDHHWPDARRCRAVKDPLQGADHDDNGIDWRTADHDELSSRTIGLRAVAARDVA